MAGDSQVDEGDPKSFRVQLILAIILAQGQAKENPKESKSKNVVAFGNPTEQAGKNPSVKQEGCPGSKDC